MKIDFTIKSNIQQGIGLVRKPEDQNGSQRITFLMTKKQRSILSSYCLDNEFTFSDVIRMALSDYFEKVGYNPNLDEPQDDRQIKMF